MKMTLYLKIADLAVQLLTILIPLIAGIVTAEPGIILIAYFFVGCAQLLSAFFNGTYLDTFYRHSGRRIYHWALVGISIWVAVLAAFNVQYTPILICFFVVCGFMAILYLYVSIAETRYIYKLIHREQYTRI